MFLILAVTTPEATVSSTYTNLTFKLLQRKCIVACRIDPELLRHKKARHPGLLYNKNSPISEIVTFTTGALYHEVYITCRKAFAKANMGDLSFREALGLPAAVAMEMQV